MTRDPRFASPRKVDFEKAPVVRRFAFDRVDRLPVEVTGDRAAFHGERRRDASVERGDRTLPNGRSRAPPRRAPQSYIPSSSHTSTRKSTISASGTGFVNGRLLVSRSS